MIDRKCLNRLQLSMYCIRFVTLRFAVWSIRGVHFDLD